MTLDYIKTYRWQDMVVKGHFTFYLNWYRSRRGRFFMPKKGSTGPEGPVRISVYFSLGRLAAATD